MPTAANATLCVLLLGPLPTRAAGAEANSSAAQEVIERIDIETLDTLGLEDLLDIAVTTPAKKALQISEAPAIVSVITAQQIKRYGYRTVADALRSVPGIYVRDDLIHPNVSLRGIDAGLRAWSRNIKVLLDGQPIAYRCDTSNWLGPELIPMIAIERIEVLRGPGSALYGANAFLGVVNIITRAPTVAGWGSARLRGGLMVRPCERIDGGVDPSRLNGGTLDGQDICADYPASPKPAVYADLVAGHALDLGSSLRGTFALGGTVGMSNRSGLLLPESSPHFAKTGPRYYSDPQTGEGELASRRDRDRPLGLLAQAELSGDAFGTLRIDGHFSRFERGGEFTDWGVLTHENRIAMWNGYLRLAYDRDIAATPLSYGVSLAAAAGGDSDRNRLQVARQNNFYVTRDGGYVGYDAAAELRYDWSDDGGLIVGADLSADSHELPTISSVLKDGGSTGAAKALTDVATHTGWRRRFVNVGAFVQSVVAPTEGLSLTSGLRYDWHNAYGTGCSRAGCTGLNARVGGAYALLSAEDVTIYAKALAGTSFKAPPAELLHGRPYVISGITGNASLTPESARTLELAVGAKLFQRLEMLLNGFYSRVVDKVEYIQAGNFTRAMNSSDLDAWGLEASVDARYGAAVHLYANLSWQHTETSNCRLADPSLCAQLVEYNALYPDLLANAGVTYRPPLPLTASLYGTYVGRRWASQSNRLENLPEEDNYGFDHKVYRLPGYVLMSVVLTSDGVAFWGDRETTFSLGVYNLLNRAIAEPGFRGIDTPGLGLTTMLSLQQDF